MSASLPERKDAFILICGELKLMQSLVCVSLRKSIGPKVVL